jgi:hypothetical protein
LGACAEIDFCSGAIPEFKMPSNKIGMQMAKKNVANLQSVAFRAFEIALNIPLRIDDHRGVSFFVANQVGSMRKTIQVELLKNHVFRPPFRMIICKGLQESTATGMPA